MELFYVGYVKGAETDFELLVSFCSTHEFQNLVVVAFLSKFPSPFNKVDMEKDNMDNTC